MRYVVSDIHGCFDALYSALDFSNFDKTQDELYILGDILDRGPQNAELVNFIVENADCIHLLQGNHEDMWLADTTQDHENLRLCTTDSWSQKYGCGGYYLSTSEDLFRGTTVETRKKFFDMVKKAPVLQTLKVNDQIVVLVHAGLRPPVAGGDWFDQNGHDLTWIRKPWLSTSKVANFLTVFGHTPVQTLEQYGVYHNSTEPYKVAYWNNKIDIDCGIVNDGALALLCLETFDVWYTNQDKELIAQEKLQSQHYID